MDVVYIDYGSSEHVDKSRLCIDFPEEFLQYPAMALKCQLSGIRPVSPRVRNLIDKPNCSENDFVKLKKNTFVSIFGD